MKIRTKTYFPLTIAAAILLAMYLSLKLEASSKLLPLLVGGVTLFLILLQLVGELRGGKSPAESTTTATGGGAHAEAATTTERAKCHAYLLALSWSAGFLLGIYLFGFIIAIAAFALAYMKTHGANWRVSIIFAVIVGAGMWASFVVVMRIDLFPGIVTPLILPWGL